jgi:hypothetical protein
MRTNDSLLNRIPCQRLRPANIKASNPHLLAGRHQLTVGVSTLYVWAWNGDSARVVLRNAQVQDVLVDGTQLIHTAHPRWTWQPIMPRRVPSPGGGLFRSSLVSVVCSLRCLTLGWRAELMSSMLYPALRFECPTPTGCPQGMTSILLAAAQHQHCFSRSRR